MSRNKKEENRPIFDILQKYNRLISSGFKSTQKIKSSVVIQFSTFGGFIFSRIWVGYQ